MKKGDETLILVVSKQAKQVDVFATVRLVLTRQKTAAAYLCLARLYLYHMMPPANVTRQMYKLNAPCDITPQ